MLEEGRFANPELARLGRKNEKGMLGHALKWRSSSAAALPAIDAQISLCPLRGLVPVVAARFSILGSMGIRALVSEGRKEPVAGSGGIR